MIATSGLVSRIQACDFSKPENTRFQYGSSVLWLSIAAPMAGTCDAPIPATILATGYFRLADLDLGFALVFALDFVLGFGFGFAFALAPETLFVAPARSFDGSP